MSLWELGYSGKTITIEGKWWVGWLRNSKNWERFDEWKFWRDSRVVTALKLLSNDYIIAANYQSLDEKFIVETKNWRHKANFMLWILKSVSWKQGFATYLYCAIYIRCFMRPHNMGATGQRPQVPIGQSPPSRPSIEICQIWLGRCW